MNFYLLENDPQTRSILQTLIETDFNNTLVGATANSRQAYEDLLQFRVDVMILAANLPETTAAAMMARLAQVHIHPRFIVTGTPRAQRKSPRSTKPEPTSVYPPRSTSMRPATFCACLPDRST